MRLTTYKQKLQEDYKTVLQYQLIMNRSLRDIHPSETISSMKRDIENKWNNVKSFSKVIHGGIDEKIKDVQELYKLKEMHLILKFNDNGNTLYYIRSTKTKAKDVKIFNNKEEFLNTLINDMDPYTDFRIMYCRSIDDNSIKKEIKITINNSPLDRIRYIKYLKYNHEIFYKYHIFSKRPLGMIINQRCPLTVMESDMNRTKYRNVFKCFDSIESLLKIDTNNIKGDIKFSCVYADMIDDTIYDEYTHESLEDLVKFVSNKGWLDLSCKFHYIKHVDDSGVNTIITINVLKTYNTDDEKYELYRNYINTSKLNTINEFNGYIFTHGLAAYNDRLTIEEKVKNILENKNISICCAWKTEYVGPIGVYIEGDCKLAAHFDLCSIKDSKTGDRYVHKNDMNDNTLLYSPDKINQSNKLSGEAIVTNCTIVGIWVDKNYDYEDNIKTIKELTGIDEVTLVETRYCS